MPASPKRSMKTQARPLQANPWSEWMDVAVGIGQAVVAYELMFVAALSPPPRRTSRHRARLVLVHSCATAPAPARPGGRPGLQSVPRRDEGKA